MSDKGVVFLEGRKVILRPFDKATDLETVIRWINDPLVRHFVSMALPSPREREAEWFDKMGKDDKNIVLAIVAKSEMKLIGSMGIHQINWVDRVATTGAMIGEKDYWGKGYGTDAKMLVLDYLFNRLNFHKVCSSVIAFNKRSLAYSLHCGYRIEGTRRQHIFRNGRYWSLIELGLLRHEWLPVWKRYRKTGKVR
jgi:RimJ/RimL family protein N-acetyltransferase